ncbi:unnamed protein product [Angiostrongylus costaricensis]|uniref:Threonine--tRNA ligase n=1 Tax=Angiostrongylus costaricensis TaxID=334426 RepID=A0A0R3PCI7_ANGCS|nr:unnamed protein product [Angiostrongylus costaricensis]
MLDGSMWEPGGLSQRFSEEGSRLATMRAEILTANCSGHCRFYEHQSPLHPELPASLDFLSFFYKKVMKYDVEFELATRPKRSADFDTEETRRWNDVEETLKAAFGEECIPLKVNSDAAPYYGPRINIVMRDPYGRFYLHGWMQLDFELPERLGLSYVGEDGSRLRPVLIHRALVAPVEIFLCIILTDCQQLLPFWLSPRQVSLVAVSTESTKYAHRVAEELIDGNFEVPPAILYTIPQLIDGVLKHVQINSDFDFNGPLNKRIKAAVEAGYTFIIVVLGEFPLDDVLSEFRRFVDEHCSDDQCYEMLEKSPRYQEPPLCE